MQKNEHFMLSFRFPFRVSPPFKNGWPNIKLIKTDDPLRVKSKKQQQFTTEQRPVIYYCLFTEFQEQLGD